MFCGSFRPRSCFVVIRHFKRHFRKPHHGVRVVEFGSLQPPLPLLGPISRQDSQADHALGIAVVCGALPPCASRRLVSQLVEEAAESAHDWFVTGSSGLLPPDARFVEMAVAVRERAQVGHAAGTAPGSRARPPRLRFFHITRLCSQSSEGRHCLRIAVLRKFQELALIGLLARHVRFDVRHRVFRSADRVV